MDDKEREGWSGGLWEQPERRYPAPPVVVIPPYRQMQKKALQPDRRKKRVRGRFLGFLLVICGLTLLTVLIRNSLEGHILPDVGGLFREEWEYYQVSEAVEPAVAKTGIGSGVTVALAAGDGMRLSNQDIYSKNLPSIVFIDSVGENESGTGTGIVLTQDGYIITNAHVISGARTIEVVLWDDSSYQAKLVGWHAREDLAVIKIEAEGLVPAEFGDSSQLKAGDDAFAMGNPLGFDYRASFTNGIISAVDRYIPVDDVYMNLIQTTAAINFGNSGGALINGAGQVVGITTIKIMSSEGTIEAMGFAIPSTRVKQVVDRLIAGEEILAPAMGISIRPDEENRGLRVEEVKQESDAYAKGLAVGDILIEADGQALRRNGDLARVIANHMVGETLYVTVLRENRQLEFEIVLMNGDLFS